MDTLFHQVLSVVKESPIHKRIPWRPPCGPRGLEGMSETPVGLKGQKRVSEGWKGVLGTLAGGLRDKRESQSPP